MSWTGFRTKFGIFQVRSVNIDCSAFRFQVRLMKTYTAYILIVVAALGIGLGYRSTRVEAPPQTVVEVDPPQQQPDPPKTENTEPKLNLRAIVPTPPEPVPAPVIEATTQPVKTPAPKVTPKPSRDEVRRQRAAQYWRHMAKRFGQQQNKLNREEDPNKRLNLIRAMAAHVRIDTLSALDWAMNLSNPDEKRAALKAINDKALSGIGARIEVGQGGLPKIRETTILSAAASTGRVEPGDYISGMVNADGSTIYFKDRPIQEVARFLRGQPGTEIRLLMERSPTVGSTQPIPFDVIVQRSMIVMQPPL